MLLWSSFSSLSIQHASLIHWVLLSDSLSTGQTREGGNVITDRVHKIPCASCEKCYQYIGETGRKFGTRLKEHKTEVEAITSKPLPDANVHKVYLSRTNQHWLTMQLTITMWLIGRPVQFCTENLTKVFSGSKTQYIFGKRDDNPWGT